MKVDFVFKHVDSSEALVEYCRTRLGRLERLALKPMEIRFTFSMQKHERVVGVELDEGRRKFRAEAACDDFYRAVEMTLNRLWRQLSKDRHRIKETRGTHAADVAMDDFSYKKVI